MNDLGLRQCQGLNTSAVNLYPPNFPIVPLPPPLPPGSKVLPLEAIRAIFAQ